MRSNNPVFNNNPAFNGQSGYGQATYPQPGNPQQGYPQGGYLGDHAPYGAPQQAPQAPTRAMTIDDVVQKTGISMAVVLAVATATWVLTGDVNSGDVGTLVMLTSIGMFAGLGIGLVCSFKRSMLSPVLVLLYAAAQGLFMGGISKIYDAQYSNGGTSIVFQAILGTIFAAGGVLAAYKFFDVKIGDKFRKGVIAASFGFLGLGLLELVLSFAGHPIGLFENGGMGLIFAIAGLGFGIVGLLLDFDMIENGLRAGVPEKFAWTAAFGLTASLVMVYFYLLRILSILQSD